MGVESNMRWKVRVIGPKQELQDLSSSLCSDKLSIAPDKHDQYYLACSQFDGCNSAHEVLEISKQVLSVLNGAAKLALDENLNLTESEVLEVMSDGTKTAHMHFTDTIHMRTSFSFSIFDVDGNVIEEHKPANLVPILMESGLSDQAVGKALRLFGLQHDWVGLYRIFEVIENDVGNIDKIAAHGWPTKSQLRLFKHTANSPGATGDEARHGKEATESPSNPMLLSEARTLIKVLMHYWLRSKGISKNGE